MTTDAYAMNSSATTRDSSQPVLWLGQRKRWFTFSAGGILVFGGITRLFEVFGIAQQLNISDPIVLIPFRQLLLCIGIAELIVASLCLFTDKQTLSAVLIAWLITIYLVYRVSLWTMGWYHPYPLLVYLMQALNLSAFMADIVTAAISAFLLIGSVRILWIEKERRMMLHP